jgi:amino acid/amide ABC transporter ATP-binding protein 2, HAAT family (TC 3.A.1.4.-)
MISVENLDAGYGKIHILHEISFKTRKGKITAVVGPNGSGKSTLLKTIFGQTTIYNGVIRLDGDTITGKPSHVISRLGVSYLPQLNNLFTSLTVRENLLMSGYTLDEREREERLSNVLEVFPFLRGVMNRRAYTLSGGERQMLSIAMAFMRRPKVIMMDEPTASLSPKMTGVVLNVVKSLRDDYGYTVILAEQNVIKTLQLADDAILMVSGRVTFHGDAQELLASKELGKMYLGLR